MRRARAAGLFSPERTSVPIDLLVKRSLHLSPSLHAFLGVGPVLAAELTSEEVVLAPGILTSVGAYWWLDEHLGLVGELDSGLLVWPTTLVEIEGAVGVAWRY